MRMIDEGMTIARINLAHGTTKHNMAVVQTIKDAYKERPNSTCAIMVDTRGQDIRLLPFDGVRSLKFKKDDVLKISADSKHKGN